MVARKLCLQLCQQHCIFAWMKTLVVGSSFTYFTRKSDSPLCLYGKRLDHVFKKKAPKCVFTGCESLDVF